MDRFDPGFMGALVRVVYLGMEQSLPKHRPFLILILIPPRPSSNTPATFEGQITIAVDGRWILPQRGHLSEGF